MTVDLVPDSFASGTFTITVWTVTPLTGVFGSVVVPPGGSTGSASAFIPSGEDCQASVSATGSAPGVDVLQTATVAVGSAAPTTYDPSRDVEIIRPGTTTAFAFTLTSVSQGVGEEAPDPATRAPVRVLSATG